MLTVLLVTGLCLTWVLIWQREKRTAATQTAMEDADGRPPLDVELLTVNPYSRPGTANRNDPGDCDPLYGKPGEQRASEP